MSPTFTHAQLVFRCVVKIISTFSGPMVAIALSHHQVVKYRFPGETNFSIPEPHLYGVWLSLSIAQADCRFSTASLITPAERS